MAVAVAEAVAEEQADSAVARVVAELEEEEREASGLMVQVQEEAHSPRRESSRSTPPHSTRSSDTETSPTWHRRLFPDSEDWTAA